jgi:hypothetical protein
VRHALPSALAESAIYFPLSAGRFTVVPGFTPLTTPFGNGEADTRLFQIDRNYAQFRANVVTAREERFDKYVCFDADFDTVAPEVCALILNRLLIEYPEYFQLQGENARERVLSCQLTGEELWFDPDMRLTNVAGNNLASPPYRNAFDALVSQVPEDVAVVALPAGKPDANVALHITAPSHWAPGEKIGVSFLRTHDPVPHFERIAAASTALLETILIRPPVVRFNWGVEFTDRLNLHPEPPPGMDSGEWKRRHFSASGERSLYLRIERQVLWSVGGARALLFAIRVYVRPVATLTASERSALHRTLLSMSEDSRLYKGLPPETFAETVHYLST